MKIIKPLRLSVLQRPFRWQEKNYLGVSVLALVDMGPNPQIRPEMELWQLADKELKTSGGVVDLAIPKIHAEFLATGQVYTHHQQEKTSCMARIDIENLSKSLIISGDRYWDGSKITPPHPFGEMPLDWCHAYGGKGFDDNPHGIGFMTEIIDGHSCQRLPNVEALTERITLPTQKAEPASFGSLEFQWPRRFRLMGKKYDAHWLQYDFPGFARDINRSVFNTASPDQWWHDRDTLPSQASWRIWNMHPEKPVQEGKLPPWHARCFINRQSAQSERFEEVFMRATTVWFFPHREQMLIIWQGQIRINEDDAADVLQLVSALEMYGVSRSRRYYRKVLSERMDKEKGALFSFREKDLLPKEVIGPWIDHELEDTPGPMSENLQNRAKLLREHHIRQLEQSGDYIYNFRESQEEPELPAPEDLPEFLEKMESQAKKMKSDAEQHQREAEAANPQIQRNENLLCGPENMHRTLEMLYSQSPTLSESKIAQTRESLHQMYLSSVQYQPPALRLKEDTAQIFRHRAERTLAKGGDFSGMDLTGVNFSDMDLRGANFSRAMLECADLRRCQLDGSNFTGAMLARAQLHQTSLRQCDFSGASLALAQCRESDFSGSCLRDIQLHSALFDRCIFDNSHLEGLLLRDVCLIHCSFRKATIDCCVFMALTIVEPDFYDARLFKTSFIQSVLKNAIFSSAKLVDCSLVQTLAEGARFDYVTLITSAVTSESSLNDSDFSHSTIKQCNFRQTALKGGQFFLSKIENSDLSESICKNANFKSANLAGSMFVRTDFREADFSDANLMGALLQKSQLAAANFNGANLFRADLSQSFINSQTRFDGALMKFTKMLPKRGENIL